MTTARRSLIQRIDPGLLLTLALCVFSLWPLFARPGLPNGDDVLYHVYRAAEMDRTWAHGVVFPRWAETFYTGYGAPLFHYYASLTYYLTSIFTRLFGLNAVDALRLLIALAMLGGGAGMYAFARRLHGSLGGVIAAVVYVYSPYFLFTEPYSRGAYPELLALALFPALLWLYSRLLAGGRALDFVLAALATLALILAHNLMAVVLTGLLGGWLVWELLAARLTGAPIRPRLVALLAVGVGVGLAAYFWLPVFSEGDAVRLNNLTGVAGVSELDYRRFFVPLEDLLAASPRVDAGALNGLEHQLNLGVAQWFLAVSGLVTLTYLTLRGFSSLRTQDAGRRSIYFSLMGLVTVLLMLPTSDSVWGFLRPLSFLQFPWRFLGPAGICLAVVAGANAAWIARLPARSGTVAAGAIILLVIVLSAPTLYVTEWTHSTVDTSIAAYHDAELRGLQRATTFSNEYMPATVAVEPGATPRLLADYADGYPVNKAHLETLPEGVTVEPVDHGPQHDVWTVESPAPFTLEVLTYTFPGWQAEIDGTPVPVTPSDPHGLITLPVPAGAHTVRLWLGSTPSRDVGKAVSLLSALVLVGVVVILRRQLSAVSRQPSAVSFSVSSLITYHSLLFPVVALVFLALYLREGGAWVQSPPGEARMAQHTTDYRLGDAIRLIGYDLNGAAFRPGDRVKLRLYWYATGAIAYGYSSFVHISTGGPPLAQADKLNPAGLPTQTWTSGGYIHDDYVITLPADMPPGEYALSIGLYTCETRPPGECGNGDRLIVTDGADSLLGDTVPLAIIRIEG